MKINKFLIAAMAATLTLASCSKEDSGDKGKAGDGETTYAGVSITLPANMTRAEDASAGTTGEKTVTSIGIYIVDVSNQRLDYKVLTVASNFTQSTVGGRSVYTATTAVPTVTGMKKVYIVANPTTAIQNKLEVQGAYVMGESAFGITEENFLNAASSTVLTDMVMSGAYTGTGGELDMTTAKTDTEAIQTANLVDITISRNLSKAVVQRGNPCTVVGGTTTLTWTLINRAKDAYLLPQSAGTLYRTVPGSALLSSTDSYWSNFSGMTGSNYIGVLDYGSGDAKEATYAQSKYMFENFPAALHEGNTTAARIKGVFVPTTIYNDSNNGVRTTGTVPSSGDFYRSKVDGTYWTPAGRSAAISDASDTGHTTTTDFTFYPGGVGYYTIWVNDGAGVKGVNRNSFYLMQISEVKGPGSPEEAVDPVIPVEDDTYLGVNITVLNWDYNVSVQPIQ